MQGILVLIFSIIVLGVWKSVEVLINVTIITDGWFWVGIIVLIVTRKIKKHWESIENTIGGWLLKLRVWWHKTKLTLKTYLPKRK